MYKTKNGLKINLSKAKEIAAGGEGRILEHSDKTKVYKIYHTPRKKPFDKHLEILSSLGKQFVTPGEIIYTDKDEIVGFIMDYVNFNHYWLFNNLFNKGFCTSNRIDSDFKINVLRQLKSGIEELHSKDIVVGDLNQYNLFVSKTGDLLFIDVDSYSTSLCKPSGILLDDIRDFTTTNINKATDSWSFDILTFWSLTFCHPFKWVVPGNTETLEQRIKSSKSFLTKITGMKIPPLYIPPVGDMLKQFSEIFNGRRYLIDFDNKHVQVSTVVRQKISSSSVSIRELHTNVLAVNACSDYIAIQIGGCWILIETKIQKVTRDIRSILCDELYPSDSGKCAYVEGDFLYSDDGSRKHSQAFSNPTFYYRDSSLQVLDYATDIQWNFNINNQLSGIDSTSLQVFTKSIIVRDSPIQNFGLKKFLNIPVLNSYTLVEVNKGIKNAYSSGNFYSIEYKDRSQIKYSINEFGSNNVIEFDYLPYFTTKGGLVFVPSDGEIIIYKDTHILSKLDVPNCTCDSKLFMTNAGIILYEQNTVYLLNTK